MTKPQRFDVPTVAPAAYQAMRGLHAAVHDSGLAPVLLELVNIRVSQINGCAFCLAMHVALARRHGLTDDRLHLLATWRDAPVFDARERAALAWAEAVSLLPGGEVSDAAYDEARRQFTEQEVAHLTFAAVEINGWNRLMIASRTPPKDLVP